ncbi:MAG: hypothetical protein ACU833_01685 [Gammaproteobacteria bacterium]
MDNRTHSRKSNRLWVLPAFLLWTLTAGAGFDEGQTAYDNGDYAKALRLWQQVVEDGGGKDEENSGQAAVTDAEYGLGLIYWYGGGGVRQDFVQAAQWFEKAAGAGHAEAQLTLGYMRHLGMGGKKDEPAARKWLLKAAEAGLVVAQYNLAQFYLKGVGGGLNREQGIYWLNRAAEQGDDKSRELLKRIQAEGVLPPQEVTETNFESPPASGSGESPRQIPVLRGPEWIMSRDKNHYAVQVIALYDKESLENFAKSHSDKGEWAYYAKLKNGKRIFVLFLCCQEEQAAAERKRLYLNSVLKGYETFPVKLEKLHSYILSEMR